MPNFSKTVKQVLKEEKIKDLNPKKATIEDSLGDLAKLPKRGPTIANTEANQSILNKVQQQIEKRANIPAKHAEFIEEWVKLGSANKAYIKTYPDFANKSIAQTSIQANNLVKKYKDIMRFAIMDRLNATQKYFFQKLIEQTKSYKIVFTKYYGMQKVPDNIARTQALKMLGEAIGELSDTKGNQGNTQNNVIIINDKEKGIFSIKEGNIEDGEIM